MKSLCYDNVENSGKGVVLYLSLREWAAASHITFLGGSELDCDEERLLLELGAFFVALKVCDNL